MPFSRETRAKAVPAEIYISLVDSLYRESPTLLIGSLATTIAVFLTAWKVSDPWIALCGLAMIAVAVIRNIHMRYYGGREGLTLESAQVWERNYFIGAGAFSFLLGVWAILAFTLHADPYIRMVSLASNIAYTIGTSGRNFGSSRSVAVQVASACIPITVALLSVGDTYYTIYAFLLLTFFVTLKFISDRLRQTLLSAVISERDFKRIASRFDTALNNMPHGLAMFNADGKLAVANRRLKELLLLPPDIADGHVDVRGLVSAGVSSGVLLPTAAKSFLEELERSFSIAKAGSSSTELFGGRTLDISIQPMENGGSVVLFEDVTERKHAEAKIAYLARFDSLTGLPNRSYFREQMTRVLALTNRMDACAVMFIDLDQFKHVNDTLGHPSGDALLSAVADRLRGIIRDSDIVARFGGDEFVVLQSPIKGPEQAASLARRIVVAVGEPYSIHGQQIIIGASVGIAIAPNDGSDGDLLLKNADMALYRAKADQRSGWCFFEPEMDIQAQARRTLELDLRTALITDSFEVYYQPLVNLKTMRIATCEALIRWPHPQRGMIPPMEFIPLAEEMGLIHEIGERILRKACAECAKWPDDVRVAVNISVAQVRRGGVPQAVRDALEGSGLAAHRLEIEITESVLLQDTNTTRDFLTELREMGVRIALDDFGTGYSSLSYLHSYPLHKVKIDRSFILDIETNERSLILLQGVARLSSALGLTVAVEGVERDTQLAIVQRESVIDEAQGYLFSRPVPRLEIRRLLLARRPFDAKVA